MAESSEMEMIDQLVGGNMSIKLVCSFFDSIEYAQKVFDIYLDKGAISFHKDGEALEAWQSKEITRNLDEYVNNTEITISLTEHAIKNISDYNPHI